MARTAFRAAIDSSGSSYTVPSGKYAVFNVMINQASSTNSFIIGTLNGSGFFYGSMGQFGFRWGPFVANAGDVIGGFNPGGFNRTLFGISGFLWDTSTVKIPFNQVIIQSSTVYTVPSGKTAVFNAFQTWNVPTSSQYGNGFILGVNGVQVASEGAIAGSQNSTLKGQVGPFTANSGEVVSVLGQANAGSSSGGQGAACLSGFLYPF